MTTLFCSHKLERFFGKVDPYLEPDYGNKFGNWNGHLFTIERKKFLLFTNDKTAYSFVLADIKKADLKDFDNLFKEALIRQLDFDLRINERQEIEIRTALMDLRLTKTNNNRSILGTMNEFISIIKLVVYQRGSPESISSVKLGYGLNNYFVGTKLPGSTKKYAVPKELMLALLR